MKNLRSIKFSDFYSTTFLTLLLVIFVSQTGITQVRGVVTDAISGEKLIGVNILIKNQDSSGTISDIAGAYSIDVNSNDTLVFSYVGYISQEIAVGNQTTLNISLNEAIELLDEVVVVGYGAVVKKDLTGAVTKIGQKDFNRGAFSSPESLINGKVAGVQISGDGSPGGSTKIRMRGSTSISADSEPLIVIDGVPMEGGSLGGRNPLNFVNTHDVEYVTVLKDASAAAIYGSRGANGVIIITTKEGKKGGPKLSYSGRVNVSNFSGGSNVLSRNNFVNAITAKAPQELEFLGEASTDWVGEVLRNGIGQDHNLNFSGATDDLNYNISLGYQVNNGVLKGSQNINKNISLNLGTSLFNDKLKINFKSKSALLDNVFVNNVIGSAQGFDPTRPILDPDSKYGGYFEWDDPLSAGNPVADLELNSSVGQVKRSLNAVNLAYDLPFLDGLTINSNLSYDYSKADVRVLSDPLLKGNVIAKNGGTLRNEDQRNYSAVMETFLSYTKKLESINSSLTFIGGHSWQEVDINVFNINGIQLQEIDGELTYTDEIKKDSTLTKNRLISFFGRVNMTLDDRYLLTASLRRDGSTKFGPANKWGLFPAFAFGWRILEEGFATGINNTFSDLKLRVGWGITGNERIGSYLFSTFYRYGTNDATYQFGDEFVRTLRGVGVDPDIKWEQTTSINLGLDFGFANGRVSGSLDLYEKKTEDLLFTVAASAFTNLSDRILTNIGEMNNKGVELVLNTVLADKKNIDWNLGFNAAYNKNKIVKLDNSNLPDFLGYEEGGISGDIGQTIQILKVGESSESFRTYQHLYGTDGKPLVDGRDWNGDGIIDLADIYQDQNDDGIVNEQDLVIAKNALPDVILGITSSLRFKKWDMSATIRAHMGNYVYNNVASSTGFFNRLSDRPPVTNNVHKSTFINNFSDKQLKSDVYIENASFMKLDNITFGYTLNTKSFRQLRVYATASNIFTLTQYSGFDPELPQNTNGIDNNLYPVSRNFLLGVNVDF